MKSRRELTQREKDNAVRLKSIFADKKSSLKITQTSVAGDLGISQSAVTQYLNGAIPLNIPIMIKFAQLLKVPITDIDPALTIPTDLSLEEIEVLNLFRSSSAKGKDLILQAALLAHDRDGGDDK